MREGLRFDGTLIPRRVKRMFDQRAEPRVRELAPARLKWRGATLTVRLGNVSNSGAMLVCHAIPAIGEKVVIELADRGPVPGVVRWVRDGRIGIHFTARVG